MTAAAQEAAPVSEQICNICLTHDPAYGGLYRSVNDFADALNAPIFAFEGDRYRVSAAAARLATAAVADAELLVVHSLFRGHATWAQAWARQHHRRYWAVPHGCLDPAGLSHHGLLKRLWLGLRGRSYLAGAERIVVSSQRSLEKARPWIPPERAVVVHWPVDLPSLAAKDESRARFRQRHGVPEAARQLLFLGRLHAIKRPIETVRAFAAAMTDHCHLVIAGMDGDLTQADVLAAVPTGCRDRVHPVGPLAGAEVNAAFLASDGFISLSWQENFGYSAAEAAAYGLPIILSPGHDLAHEMPARDGRFACGWLLGNDSQAAAVGAIGEFGRADDATLVAAGAAGRGWASDELSRERFRDRLIELAGA